MGILRKHKCWNSTCAGFSYKKCKGCMKAQYCDEECQESDSQKQHKMVCQRFAMNSKMETWALNRIEDLIKSHAKSNPPKQIKSLKSCLKEERFAWLSDWLKGFAMKEEQIRCLLEIGELHKLDSKIVDKIVTQKTYLTLLDTKKARKMKIEEAMAEVD